MSDVGFVTIPCEQLRQAVVDVLERLEVVPPDARQAADVLIEADLRGVESHGVSNLLRVYADGLRSGTITARPRQQVLRESPSTATLDEDGGLGVVSAPAAMQRAITKARSTGVGMVSARNARHLGMAAYHAMLAVPHDMIGICMTAVGPRVLPIYGREPRLGTNPIAVAAPAERHPAFVFDAATTTTAMNTVRLAQRDGTPIAGGIVANADGVPIMEPGPVPEGHHLLPLGATSELGSHKGYGLACVVEILSSLLAGSACMAEIGLGAANHFVCAIDIEALTDGDEFKRGNDAFLELLERTPPAAGQERVYVAGAREAATRASRERDGVPLRAAVVEDLDALLSELDLDHAPLAVAP